MGQKLRPKDYIVTADGLYFAVVLGVPENGRIFASLRYLETPDGVRKFNTTGALDFLKSRYSRYQFFSAHLDAETTAIPLSAISRVYWPEDAVTGLLNRCPDDALFKRARHILNYFIGGGIDPKVLGITGSLMLGFHRPDSDIDLVIYERGSFHAARSLIQKAMAEHVFSELDYNTWQKTYQRRGCSLSFDKYLFHEKRKANKFMCDETKVDISFQSSTEEDNSPCPPVSKTGISTIRAEVIDDTFIFDYPACYIINHSEIQKILVYTATYYGQAFTGETIEARGMVECDTNKNKYMIIGTNREAAGEYMHVVSN